MPGGVGTQLRCSLWRLTLTRARQWPWLVSVMLLGLAPFVFLTALRNFAPVKNSETCHFRTRTVSATNSLSMVQSFVCSLQNECQQDSQEDLTDGYPNALIHKLLRSPGWLTLWRAAAMSPEEEEVEAAEDDGSWFLRRIEEFPASVQVLATLADILNHPEVRRFLENGVKVKDVVADEAAFNETLITYGVQAPVAEAILNSRVNLHKILSLAGYPNMKLIVCDPEKLGDFLVMPTESENDLELVSEELCHLNETRVPDFADAVIKELNGKTLFDKVEQVVTAVGGYESDSTLRALANMLDAVGRLEPLIALGPVLASLSSALEPLRPVQEALLESDMSLDDVNSLLDSFESLVQDTEEGQTSLEKLRKSVATLDLRSQTVTEVDGSEGDPYSDLLGRVQESVHVSGDFATQLIAALKNDTRYHALLLLASATLPIVTRPDEYSALSIVEKYDTILPHLPTDLQEKTNQTLLTAAVVLQATKFLLDSTECVARMVMRIRDIDLPAHVVIGVAARSVNLSAVREKVANGELDDWLCSRASWPELEDEVWLDLEEKVCSSDAAVPVLSSCLEAAFQESGKPPPTSNFLKAIYSVIRNLNESLPKYENIYEMVLKDNLEEDNFRLSGSTEEQHPLQEIETEILRSLEGGKDLLQEIIRNVVPLHVYLLDNLARHPAVLGDESSFVSDFLGNMSNSAKVMELADMTSGALDALIHILSLVVNRTYESLGHIIRDTKVWKFLTRILNDDALKVAESYAKYMESPLVRLPSPLPQLLGLLEPAAIFVSRINDTYNLTQLLQEKAPLTWSLGTKVLALMPRLAALPLAWFFGGLQKPGMDMLAHPDAWPKDPCGEHAFTFFVNNTDVTTLPAPWAETHREFVAEVEALEDAICSDYIGMMEELMKFEEVVLLQERLSELGPYLQPFDLTLEDSRNVSISNLTKHIKALVEGLPRLCPEGLCGHIRTLEGKTLEEMVTLALNISAWTFKPRTSLHIAEELSYILLHKFTEDAVLNHISYFFTHITKISEAIIQHFEGGGTPLDILGPVPFLTMEDDESDDTTAERSPASLTLFLLQEALNVVSEVLMTRDFNSSAFVSGMCQRAQNSIYVVERVCSLLTQATTNQSSSSFGSLPASSVSTAIMNAIEDYKNLSSPLGATTNLTDMMESLIHLLKVLKSNFPGAVYQDVVRLEKFLNQTHQQFQSYMENFIDFAVTGPMSVLEQWVDSVPELQKTRNELGAVVLWFNRTLPNNASQVLNELAPTEVKDMLSLLNETLPDLIDLIQYNLDPETSLAINATFDPSNLTLHDLCNKTSALHQLPTRNITDNILEKWCSFNFSVTIEAVKDTLGLEELQKQVLCGCENVSLSTMWRAAQSVFLRVRGLAEQLRSSDIPPSLLQLKELWFSLAQRLASRWNSWDEELRKEAMEVILGWMMEGESEVDSEVSFKTVQLLMERAKVLLGFVLKAEGAEIPMSLKDDQQLSLLLTLLTTSLPAAVKDVHNLLTTDPHEIFKSLVSASADLNSIPNVNSSLFVLRNQICSPDAIANIFNISEMLGNDIGTNANTNISNKTTRNDIGGGLDEVRHQLCSLNFEDLLDEVRELALLPEIKNTSMPSTSDLISSAISLHDFLEALFQAESNTSTLVDPASFLNLQNWLDLPQELFGVSVDVYWNRSVLLLATALEPLMAQSRENSTEGEVVRHLIDVLNAGLRSLNFVFSFTEGGNVWNNLYEAYMDKPLVITLLDFIGNLPELMEQYMRVFSHVPEGLGSLRYLVNGSQSACDFNQYLIETARSRSSPNSLNISLLEDFKEFLCDLEESHDEDEREEGQEGTTGVLNRMGPLMKQLLPWVLPRIANVSMEVDSAMLAMQLDTALRRIVTCLRKASNHTNYTVDWSQVPDWRQPIIKLMGYLNRTTDVVMAEMVEVLVETIAAEVNVSDADIAQMAGAILQVAEKLAYGKGDFIEDLLLALSEFGSMGSVINNTIQLMPHIKSILAALQKSELYYKLLVSPRNLPVTLTGICSSEGGVRSFLEVPDLPEYAMDAFQSLLCQLQPEELVKDMAPLWRSTEEVLKEDGKPDWLKMVQTIDKVLLRLQEATGNWSHLTTLWRPPQDEGVKDTSIDMNSTKIWEMWVRGAFLAGSLAHPRLLDMLMPPAKYYWFLIQGASLLRPLASIADLSMDMLTNATRLRTLMQSYADILSRMTQNTDDLNSELIYQSDEAPNDIAKFIALYQLYESFEGALRILGPIRELQEKPEKVLQILHSVALNTDLVLLIGLNPFCSISLEENVEESEEENGEESEWMEFDADERRAFQAEARLWLGMARRQLTRWPQFKQLACEAKTLDLSELVTALNQKFDWSQDRREMQEFKEGRISVTCRENIHLAGLVAQQVVKLSLEYMEDEVAADQLQECFWSLLSSPALQQLSSLLQATALLVEVDVSNVTKDVDSSIANVPGISSALNSLSARLPIFRPVSDILVGNFEEYLQLEGELLDMFMKHGLIDVNRVYGSTNITFIEIFSSKENMKKCIKFDEESIEEAASAIQQRRRRRSLRTSLDLWDQVLSTVKPPYGRRIKRATLNVKDLENLFYEYIQEIGVEAFAERLSTSINYEYVLDNINDMRMESLVELSLEPLAYGLSEAFLSMQSLIDMGAIFDLSKVVSGETDPLLVFQKVNQMLQHETWQDLSNSLTGLVNASMPLLGSSEIGDDIIIVQEGVMALEAATDWALLDPTYPLNSLVDNWDQLSADLTFDLGLDPEVLTILQGAAINFFPLVTLKEGTVKDVVCKEELLAQVLLLPEDTIISHTKVSNDLCSVANVSDLATAIVRHLDIGPVMQKMLRLSINMTLASKNLTEEEVRTAVRMLTEAWELWPKMIAIHNVVVDLLEELEVSGVSLKERFDSLESLSSKEFLERSGRILCGYPLRAMSDSLGLVKPPKKVQKRAVSGVCSWFYDQLAQEPGGKVIYHYLRPLIRGKLFYTPNNVLTQRIITQANTTFETVARLRGIMAGVQQIGVQMSSSSHEVDNLEKLSTAVKAPWVVGFLNQLSDGVTLQQLHAITNNSVPDLTSQSAKDMGVFLDLAVSVLDCLLLDRFEGTSDEGEMLEMVEDAARRKEFLAGIVFEINQKGSLALPKNISYRLRFDYDNSPNTAHLLPLFWRPGPYNRVAQNMRYHRGFVQLQQLLDDAIIKEQLVERTGSLGHTPSYVVETKQQPYPCHAQDRFLEGLNDSPVLATLFSFVAFTAFIMFLIKDRVQEKESKNQQLQEVMGKLQWVDLLLWSCLAILQLFVLLVPIALILKFGGLQPRSDLGLLLALLLAYGVSIIAFCYLLTCLMTSSVLAIFVGIMGVMVFNTPFVCVSLLYSTTSFVAYVLLSLFPSSAFSFGLRVICQYEMQEIGAKPDNFWKPPTTENDMTLGLAIVMMIIDAFVFVVIAVIVSISKKYHWTLCPRLWGPSQITLPLRIGAKQSRGSCAGTDSASAMPQAPPTPRRTAGYTYNIFQVCCKSNPSNIAQVSPMDEKSKDDRVHLGDLDPGLRQSLKKGLSIVGLRKIYQSREGSTVAVDNLSLELYEGQILALLGHNGAGKTTIISMLTGERRPTAGHVEIYGHDIARHWNRARRFIGLCPQEAVTFLLLTVKETIEYYVRMKGIRKSQVAAEVDKTLVEMGLYRDRQMLAHQLSGGLVRRLCLAIAFCGNSKMVILDEPTSGVDPAARSAIWEVISSHRGGRTILLTTHHLDEAETLADRVAILHQGKLICVGSPLALKSEYGSGYNATFSTRPSSDGQIEDGLEKTFGAATPTKVAPPEPKKEELWELLKEYAPNVRLLQDINGEVTYALPLQDLVGTRNRLPELMGKIEENFSSLGFNSFEIRPTSLEDVVLALSAVYDLDSSIAKNSSCSIANAIKDEQEEDLKTNYSFRVEAPVEGLTLVARRLGALLLKRFLHHYRDWRFYVQMIVLPLIFIILAMIGSCFRPNHQDPVALELSTDHYTTSHTSSSFIRNLDIDEFGDLEKNLVKVCLGSKDDLSLKTCPSQVSATTPKYQRCSGFINASKVESECWCGRGSCVLDASTQPSLDKFLVATRRNHIQNRFIGYTLGAQDDSSNSSSRVIVWYDNSGLHALPVALNALSNAQLRMLLNDEDLAIRATNHPVRISGFRLEDITVQQHVADLGIGLLLMVALTTVCCCTVAYPVAERSTGERRVLYVSGISRSIYWVSAYIWDSGVLILNVLLVTLVLLAFDQPQFVERHNLGGFILLTFLYGQSLLPLYYMAESFFKAPATAVIVFFCITFGLGLIPITILSVLENLTWDKRGSTGYDVEDILKFLFIILPPFAFVSGTKDLGFSYLKAKIMEHFEEDTYVSPFTWDLTLTGGLGLYYFVFFMWVILSHITLHGWRRCFGPLPQPVLPKSKSTRSSGTGRGVFASGPRAGPGAEEDRDVAAERIKIQCGGASVYESVLRVVGLGRDFTSPPVTAVSALYLALRKGECFGLLGLNGAGKTTAFRCLTGDLQPTRGAILINGKPLEEALRQERPVMSYCPQSHALDPNLTPSEAMRVMAKIRGFPSKEIPQVVQRVLACLGLTQHTTTLTKRLSGGCKRKLSTALALLGDPLLVLLDEPTSGMDPKSRRLVWRAIHSVVQSGRTCLLTSHSMDEVNHLTHRLAIMVNGHFVCLGSPHYLKHKLGDKYSLKIRAEDIEDMSSVIEYLRSKFPTLLLKDHHHLTLLAEVPRQTPLHSIFEALEECRALGVTEYDVAQTTLNQVFQLLASHQGDGQLPAVGAGEVELALPSHLPTLQPIIPSLKKQPLYDKPTSQNPPLAVPPPHQGLQPVLPGTVEEEPDSRWSIYDNNEDGGVGGRGSSPGTSSGTADDSPDEEWTHL
ncbi:uncharacterized protein LOC143021347 [Oratosquilla oratoria]|uniref:uncharacterized protein LOC143021347 n=1 Tax=Oratosquilla oratoria TaxID=337810 RepID=UPI003F75FE63